MKKNACTLGNSGEFIIENYNAMNPFSSFLPGISGIHGMPMWAFYVNRGQCLCSMGVQDKDHAIMEFLPANRAYQLSSSQGFRTFLKLETDRGLQFYEPFQNTSVLPEIDCSQRMIIRPESLSIEEVNHTYGLLFRVDYFTVPDENFAGIMRRLTLRNLSSSTKSMEVLDGLPLIIPFGVDNLNLKYMRRLVEAFVEVVDSQSGAAFFRSKVKQEDSPEVVKVEEGNFYLAYTESGEHLEQVIPIVDPQKIFGSFSDFRYPVEFMEASPFSVKGAQMKENVLPCAMGHVVKSLDPGEVLVYFSALGSVGSLAELDSISKRVCSAQYFRNKEERNEALIHEISQHNFVCSSEPGFDYYCRMNFLDNVLRGGLPVSLEGLSSRVSLYVYARKHGDLERDYNEFCLSPSFFSQGNSNYRDVNQNRRNDLFVNPDLKDHNVRHFYNMIQLDGFNPLLIKPVKYKLQNTEAVENLLQASLSVEGIESALELMKEPFLAGSLLQTCREVHDWKPDAIEQWLADILDICETVPETEHLHGYWTDHWVYNLDLLINYISVYPEKVRELVFDDCSYVFHDSAYRVASRKEKYVLWENRAMQLDAVVYDHEKDQCIKKRSSDPECMRDKHGHGKIYRTTLLVKMLSLIVNKLSSLDPCGVGVEMEAGKPNWYDALNGLPGIHGSSLHETIEIKRNILFLVDLFDTYLSDGEEVRLPGELQVFLTRLHHVLHCKYQEAADFTDYDIWDAASTAREQFRESVFWGIEGTESIVTIGQLKDFFYVALKRLDDAVHKAWDSTQDLPHSYFINRVVEYELIDGVQSARGLPVYRARKFTQEALPVFLEAVVHVMKVESQTKRKRELYQSVRASGLYDAQLGMYKVNESLQKESLDIGRTRIFTPGWFENESIWLHMEYKYMLELLRGGLYTEFFADFRQVFVPFFDPAVYGRSILENSSFIVSSANRNASLHGAGFAARLSGATAEFIHILRIMTAGETPFSLDESGKLQLEFRPVIPAWMFIHQAETRQILRNGCYEDVLFPANSFSFMFMQRTLVTLINEKRRNTFGFDNVRPVHLRAYSLADEYKSVNGSILRGGLAEEVRGGRISRIDILLA
ncbi:hypothetical protein [Spirochaeta dissipatitropha]